VAFVKNWSLTLVTSSIILYLFLVLGIFLPMILKVNAQITKARTPITRALTITDQKIRQRAEPVQSLVKRWQVLEW
jgi:hypothetical protein